jgi:hypothetical protein
MIKASQVEPTALAKSKTRAIVKKTKAKAIKEEKIMVNPKKRAIFFTGAATVSLINSLS